MMCNWVGLLTVFEGCDALKGDPKIVGIGEAGRIVEELDVLARKCC